MRGAPHAVPIQGALGAVLVDQTPTCEPRPSSRCVCVSVCAGDGGNRALEPRPVNSVVQLVTCRT